MIQMYDGVVNSIETVTTGAINATDTIINVLDETRIPEAPNILVLGSGASVETVKLVEKNGSVLTVERGLQGTAKSWASGTLVARNFTEYDHRAFKENIETLNTNQQTTNSQLAQDIQDLQTHKAKKVTDDVHGLGYGGVFASINPSQTIPNATPTKLSFSDIDRQTKYTFWSSGAPTRLTIPSGVSKVRLTAQVVWVHNAIGRREATILCNGVNSLRPAALDAKQAIETLSASRSTPLFVYINEFNVVAGDYFELEVYQNSGGALDASSNFRSTYLAIEVIQ